MATVQVQPDDGSPQAAVAVGYQPPKVKCHPLDDETLSRILANDPDIAGLRFSAAQVTNADDADQVGRAISRSIHLRTLEIWGVLEDTNVFHSLFTWLAHNRSIEHIEFYRFDFSEIDIFRILAPFIEQNTNLRCIDLCSSNNVSNKIPPLISALSNLGMTSRLEKINLCRNNIGDTNAARLIKALNAMPGLHNLVELQLGENDIGRKGFEALCTLLKNPECRIRTLDLTHNCLGIENMGTLICGLAVNNSIKTLNLWSKHVTAACWHLFCIFLSSPRCSIENTTILGDLGDGSAASLGDALAVNQNMKSISIGCNEITPVGWREFSHGLGSSSALVDLKLDECNIGDAGALELFQALASNTTLNKFSLSFNQDITATGWVACFRALLGSQSALEEIKFVCNDEMDDEGANLLVNLLSKHMSTVRLLDVQHNTSITTNGWRAFTDVLLPTSKSKLKSLRIGDEDCNEIVIQINDDVILGFVTALASNNSLSEFNIGHVAISPSTLDALVTVLCNKTSIASVRNSNHTWNDFYYTSNDEAHCSDDELDSLLEMNKLEDKSEVVRRKLLMSCLLNEDTVGHVFGPMPATTLPSVVEWIGRDRLGFSAMYCLVQNIPSLLEYQDAQNSETLESPRKLRKVE
ncbi:hypothetical protein ACHAWU_005922 [Discostella pseudostelligera]|uniref:Uncharacterized protein n=1 Tax=Discostella pseudostelligera TaxID=259834 RepID=A0ABD3LYW6_9STRA